jgi:hypothetical protein
MGDVQLLLARCLQSVYQRLLQMRWAVFLLLLLLPPSDYASWARLLQVPVREVHHLHSRWVAPQLPLAPVVLASHPCEASLSSVYQHHLPARPPAALVTGMCCHSPAAGSPCVAHPH